MEKHSRPWIRGVSERTFTQSELTERLRRYNGFAPN